MDSKVFRPEPELKKMWLVINHICFAIEILAVLVMVVLGFPLWIGLLLILAWFLVYIPVIIYIPAFYKTLEYSIDNDAIRIKKGVFWRRRTTVPYSKITNIDVTQGPVERMFNVSSLHIQTAGSSGGESGKAEIVIPGIRDCEELKETIMSHIRQYSGEGHIPVVEKASEPEVLVAILTELKAIRELLARE